MIGVGGPGARLRAVTRKILLTLLSVAVLAASWTGLLDEVGRDSAQDAFARALVTFAVARTLNGVISVAQGTEVAVEPAGVGVNFAPGQMLDPINDLVERFSSVMLVATSALGAQNILLRVSGWWGMNLLVSVAAIGLLLALWVSAVSPAWRERAYRFALVAIAFRFAVPLAIIVTGLFFDTFLESEHAAATEALRHTSAEISEISERTAPPEAAVDQTLLGRLGAFIDDSIGTVDVREKLERFREGLSQASEHIINLIVIFVLQTIVVPIAFLWLLAQGLKRLI